MAPAWEQMVLLLQVQVQLQLPQGQAAHTAQHQWAFAKVAAHEMRTLDVLQKSIGPQCLPGLCRENGRWHVPENTLETESS